MSRRKKCSLIASYPVRNNVKWILNYTAHNFCDKSAFENFVCKMTTILSWPYCVKKEPPQETFFLPCSYQSKTAKTILDTILNIQPKDSGGGGGESREAFVYRLCDDMLEKLPNDYIPFEVRQRLQKMGHLQPMNIFLRQEIDRMQRVIATVRATLNDLKLAIDGTIIMSEVLRDALDCMYDAKIPKAWQKVREESGSLFF